MSKLARSAFVVLAACGGLGTLSAQAQPLHHALHHVQGGRYMSSGLVSPEPVASSEEASRRAWIGGPRDDDSANAKNPALPWYSRGRGSETGGPARMLIGE